MALEVSTQRLPKSSADHPRSKLTFPQAVVGNMAVLFPPQLQIEGRAILTMFSSDPNAGSDPFLVTAARHKQGENDDRVVLLESDWKHVVTGLGLREGDTVTISLSNGRDWIYSIEVERAPVRMEIDLNEAAQPDMNEGVVLDLNVPAPERMDIDLNKPAQPDREIIPDLNLPAYDDE